MEKETSPQIVWRDYLVIGLAVSMLLILIDSPRDGFYQIVPGIVLLFLTGIKENTGCIIAFTKKYWLLIITTVFYFIYYKFLTDSSGAIGFPITVLFVTLFGYCLAFSLREKYTDAFRMLWILLLAVILLGISKIIRYNQMGYFMDHTAELAAIVAFVEITFLYLDDKRYKIASGAVSAWSAFLLLRRNALDFSRLLYIKTIIPAYLDGTTSQKLFGRGPLAIRQDLQEMSENTFATLLYDYGVIALILYVGFLLFVVYKCIKTTDSDTRKVAIMTCMIMILSAFLSVEYWGNIGFILFSCIGIFLYRIVAEPLESKRP